MPTLVRTGKPVLSAAEWIPYNPCGSNQIRMKRSNLLDNMQRIRYNGPTGLIRKGDVSISVGTAHPTVCPSYPAVGVADGVGLHEAAQCGMVHAGAVNNSAAARAARLRMRKTPTVSNSPMHERREPTVLPFKAG